MALDMDAVTGGTPMVTSTGNVTSVPDPTMVLIVPAHNPATRISSTCHHSKPTVPPEPKNSVGTMAEDSVSMEADQRANAA